MPPSPMAPRLGSTQHHQRGSVVGCVGARRTTPPSLTLGRLAAWVPQAAQHCPCCCPCCCLWRWSAANSASPNNRVKRWVAVWCKARLSTQRAQRSARRPPRQRWPHPKPAPLAPLPTPAPPYLPRWWASAGIQQPHCPGRHHPDLWGLKRTETFQHSRRGGMR